MGEVCQRLKKYPDSECEIDIEGGEKLTLENLSEKKNIRVFNKDFVSETIFREDDEAGGVAPIYYVGSTEVELAKERKERDEKKETLQKAKVDLDKKESRLEKYSTELAKTIKNLLLGVKSFQNYRQPNFLSSFERIKKGINGGTLTLEGLKLEESKFKERLQTVKNTELLQPWIVEVKNVVNTITEDYFSRLNTVLNQKVSVQSTIQKLTKDWELSDWVQKGIPLHKDRKSERCEFCNQPLPTERLADLEKHFNKDYTGLSGRVEGELIALRKLKINELEKIPTTEIKQLAESANQLISRVEEKIIEKGKNLLSVVSIPSDIEKSCIEEGKKIYASAAEILTSIDKSASSLEDSTIADNYENYQTFARDVKESKERIDNLNIEINELETKIKSSERKIRDSALPATLINADLVRFLGHSELKFEDRKDIHGADSYEIRRGDELAYNLSEGEKTAISLIYFIRKLREEGFSSKDGVIYIDDPVSSLDSQFLFSAHAYITSAIEDESSGEITVGQFFLSTHNYDFFNLFKKRYQSRINNKKIGLYMLKINLDSASKRAANIYELDPLLRDFDSDYQYLYKLMIDFEKERPEGRSSLSFIYPYPNIARRTLETFLSFKFPSQRNYRSKLAATKVDPELQESVYRFTNLKSHGTMREIEGFTAEILEPTAKDQVLNVLKVMREVDGGHCADMEKLIT